MLWVLAEPVGKVMIKLKNEITEKKKQACKKVNRHKKDPEEAATRVIPACSAVLWRWHCPQPPRSRRHGGG